MYQCIFLLSYLIISVEQLQDDEQNGCLAYMHKIGTVQLQLHFYTCVHAWYHETQLPRYVFAWTMFPRSVYCTCCVLYRGNYTHGTILTRTHVEHDTCVKSKLTEYRAPLQL